MDVEVPPNTTATLYVPATSADQIAERGKPLAKAKGVQFVRIEGNAAVLIVGAGRYNFSSTGKP